LARAATGPVNLDASSAIPKEAKKRPALRQGDVANPAQEAEKHTLVAIIRSLSAAGKTALFVEHDMAFVGELSQRIIVLDHGILIADGRLDAVRSDPKVIEASAKLEFSSNDRSKNREAGHSAKRLVKESLSPHALDRLAGFHLP
jgi:ABC-type multidrug transport system ATPase subunit